MSYLGDKAREIRHAQSGGKRITARISGEAYEALYVMAQDYRLPVYAVLDLLILGGHSQDDFGSVDGAVRELHGVERPREFRRG